MRTFQCTNARDVSVKQKSQEDVHTWNAQTAITIGVGVAAKTTKI